ncbi:ESCRT-III subunit protein snf7 [Thelotrema lepadinum]|nr:ESCRT-III subunit protein snf7 [Thelotrema lepadinum]
MWGWFGGGNAQQRKDAPKKAILQLRTQLDMLQKREKHLENQMAEQDAIARKNVSSNKTAARTALKRKKAHEHSLEQTANQITMLENQIYSIESANINQETLNAMQSAGKAMRDIHGKLNIDKVDEIMEGLTEQKALADEIGTAIASGPQTGEPLDEAELEADLAELEQEALDEKMLKTGTMPVLPGAANGELKGKNKSTEEEEDEEAELQKLQAEMAM